MLCASSRKVGSWIGGLLPFCPGVNCQLSVSDSCRRNPCLGFCIDVGMNSVSLAPCFIHGRSGSGVWVLSCCGVGVMLGGLWWIFVAMMSSTSPVDVSCMTKLSFSSSIGVDNILASLRGLFLCKVTKTVLFSLNDGGQWMISRLLRVLNMKDPSNCSSNCGPDGRNESRRYPSAL